MRQETKDFLKGAVTIIAVILLGCIGVVSCGARVEGDRECYTNFKKTYTWSSTRPALDKMWADGWLSLNECDRILYLNQKAQDDAEREEVRLQMQAARAEAAAVLDAR